MHRTKAYILGIALLIPTFSHTMQLIQDILYDYGEKAELLFPTTPITTEWKVQTADYNKHTVCTQADLGLVIIEHTLKPTANLNEHASAKITYTPGIATLFVALLPFGVHTLRTHLEADLEDIETRWATIDKKQVEDRLKYIIEVEAPVMNAIIIPTILQQYSEETDDDHSHQD
jgi:hypothetical protein